MSKRHPPTTINLRCETCGNLRTPIIHPFMLDQRSIVVVCKWCMERENLKQRYEALTFYPDPPMPRDVFGYHPLSCVPACGFITGIADDPPIAAPPSREPEPPAEERER
jgi:hypothetical protein